MILLMLASSLALAQTVPDSLLKAARMARGDSAAVAYNNVGQSVVYSNPQWSLQYFEKALDIAIQYGNYKQQCVANSFLGLAHRHLGNYNEAFDYFNEHLSVALAHHIDSEVPWAYINLGNIMLYLKNYSLSEQYLKEALSFAEQNGIDGTLPYIYVNLGRSTLLAQNYDNALAWHGKALEIRLQHPEEPVNIAVSYRDIGNVYFARRSYQESKYYYSLSKRILDTIVGNDIPASINISLAQIYLEENNIDSALICARWAYVRARQFKNRIYIRDACSMLGDIYFAKRDYRQSERYYGMQIAYNDSIKTADISRKIFEIQTLSEHYDQEKKIAQADGARNRQRAISVVLLLILAFGVAFAVVLYLKREGLKSMNAALDSQNTQLKASIAYAKKIQEAMLPVFDSRIGRIFSDRFMLFVPCEDVSGDFYWHHDTPRYEMIAVADCGVQGIPGGCMSMLASSMLHEVAGQANDPCIILEKFRKRIMSLLSDRKVGFAVDPKSMDMSIAVVDKQARRLYYSGIRTPLIYARGESICQLQDNSDSDMPTSKEFATDMLVLMPGDAIYLMTPGYCCQKGGAGSKPFSRDRLCGILGRIHNLPMQQQMKILDDELRDWRGGSPLSEDITIAGFAFN